MEINYMRLWRGTWEANGKSKDLCLTSVLKSKTNKAPSPAKKKKLKNTTKHQTKKKIKQSPTLLYDLGQIYLSFFLSLLALSALSALSFQIQCSLGQGMFFSLSVQCLKQDTSALVEIFKWNARIVIMESLYPVSQALNELIEKCQY